MFKRSCVASGVAALCVGVGSTAVWAQTAVNGSGNSLGRVEIIGTSLPRIDAETALPVQILHRSDIVNSGATSTADFLQRLPALHGGTNEANSVGNIGAGFSGASIHDLGEQRTLVLLNGRRIASFAGQTLRGDLAGIDLNTLPLAAIDRIEILTDGASAVYGSDAIGGVINVITRRGGLAPTLTAGHSRPAGGAHETRFSYTQGLGDLARDGYSAMVSLSADKRTALAATQRDFARTGVVDFQYQGRRLRSLNGSIYTDPATVYEQNDPNPRQVGNSPGTCPAGHIAEGAACYYDYTRQLEIMPVRERTSLMFSGDTQTGSQRLFADVMLARTESIWRVAPVPGDVLLQPDSPFLAAAQSVIGPGEALYAYDDGSVPAYWRLQDAGRRTTRDRSTAVHLTVGLEGPLDGPLGRWQQQTALTHSVNRYRSDLLDGWLSQEALNQALAVSSGAAALNPFAGAGQQTPEALAALRSAAIYGKWDGGVSTLDQLQWRAHTDLAQLEGGDLAMSVGASWLRESLRSTPGVRHQGLLTSAGSACDPAAATGSAGACDTRFGDTDTVRPYAGSRRALAVFSEWVAPVSRQLEFNAAVRADHYSDFGSTLNGKLATRWQPTAGWLLRGSLGTGFRAPSVAQVHGSRQDFGFTDSAYDCPFTPEQLAEIGGAGTICPTSGYLRQIAEGSRTLSPEKSTQLTLGTLLQASRNFNLGADFWIVQVRDALGVVPASAILADPQRYRSKFTTYQNTGLQQTELAVYLPVDNLGTQYRSGIDFTARAVAGNVQDGKIEVQGAATYRLRDEYQLERNGPVYSSLGQFGVDQRVAHRWQARVATRWTQGEWSHGLTANYRSGYRDEQFSADSGQVFDRDTGEYVDVLNYRVKPFITWDWNTQWQVSKRWTLSVGALNIFDQSPPLAITVNGGGQMVGYNARYDDSRGRTLYLDAALSF